MNHDVQQTLRFGPKGFALINLPAPDTRRWVPQRKAEVINAVRSGFLSMEEACTRYALSHEEFDAWYDAYERNGLVGLRASKPRKKRLLMTLEGYSKPRPGEHRL